MGVCEATNRWGTGSLEPLTYLVTDELAGACVPWERSVFWIRKGAGGASVSFRP